MGPGSLRRAIERKSPMLLHRSVRTGSSILANYSANGLFPWKRASRAQLRIPGRMEFSERTGAGTGQPRASSIFIDPLHEYAASGYGLFPFVPPAWRSTFGSVHGLVTSPERRFFDARRCNPPELTNEPLCPARGKVLLNP